MNFEINGSFSRCLAFEERNHSKKGNNRLGLKHHEDSISWILSFLPLYPESGIEATNNETVPDPRRNKRSSTTIRQRYEASGQIIRKIASHVQLRVSKAREHEQRGENFGQGYT